MKSKAILASLTLIATGLVVGNVFAAWAVTDNADSFAIQITLTTQEHTATIHVPQTSDATCTNFTTSTKTFDYGDTFGSLNVSEPSPFVSFSFEGWYSDASFTQEVTSSTKLYSDIDIYAKCSRNYVLVGQDDKFYLPSSNAQTVSSQYIYKVANQVWGVAPTKNNDNKIDLLSASGSYKLTYNNTSFSALRCFTISCSGVTWWKTDHNRLWCHSGTGVSDAWSDEFTFNNSYQASISIDYRYGAYNVVRLSSATADWANKWNQTQNISVTSGSGASSEPYSTASTILHIWNEKVDGENSDQKCAWGS